jgi:tetratricopeptide (TPR) repeat protein
MKVIAAALVAATAIGLFVLWIQPEETASVTAAAAPAGAPASASKGPAAPPRETPGTTIGGTKVAFLDERRAGGIAYSGGNYEEAIAVYRAALARNPDDAETLSNLGQVLVRLSRVEEAIPLFQRAVQLIPNRWAYHFNLARAQGLLGHWKEAVAEYEVAHGLFPNDYVTEFNLGLAHHKQGDEAAAVEACRAIALEPNDASFHLALGISLEKLPQPSEAAAAYSKYLELSPEAPDAEKVLARIAQLGARPPG